MSKAARWVGVSQYTCCIVIVDWAGAGRAQAGVRGRVGRRAGGRCRQARDSRLGHAGGSSARERRAQAGERQARGARGLGVAGRWACDLGVVGRWAQGLGAQAGCGLCTRPIFDPF